MDKLDITLDFLVLEYLKNGKLPSDTSLKSRIIKRASRYIWKDERVYYIAKNGLKLVPTIAERNVLVKERHVSSGH